MNSGKAMRALIVDSCEGRAALAGARALAQAGWTVGVGCPRALGPLGISRHVRRRHTLRPLAAGATGFVQEVGRLVAEHGYDVVFPSSDGEVLALSQGREHLRGALPYAGHQAVLKALGKRGLTGAAAEVGLRVPPTAASAAEVCERWGSSPLVVKEDRHGTFATDGSFVHIAPARFDDLSAAEQRAQDIRSSGGVPVVQPLIEGQLMAFTSVIDAEGELTARVQQISERLYPRSAGLSVRACTVEVDETLSGRARELLRRLGWFGLSEMQFILPQSGEPALVDFNGRLYGSLSLALTAGVNLPDIWGRAALGIAAETAKDARPGVRYHWLEGDLRTMGAGPAGRLREAMGCIRYALRSHGSIWRITDPLPGVWVALSLARQAIARLGPR